MKKLILLLLAVCAAVLLSQVAALAQAPGSLKGTVTDKDAQPVPFANVALYNKSKALVTGCVADLEGRYRILSVVQIASQSVADDPGGLRGEFIALLNAYKKIKG